VLLLSLDIVRRVDQSEQRAALLETLERLRNIAGVEAVSAAEFNMVGRAWTHYVRVPRTQYETIETTMAPVTPGFIETMRIPVMAGRTFVDGDLAGERASAVIVNESFAARYFDRDPAVGRIVEARFAESDLLHEVVGVVADARYDLRKPPVPTIYILLPLRMNGTIHVRVADSAVASAIGARLREEVRTASPLFRVSSIKPQSAVVDQSLLRERLLALLSGFFAAVGLVLAAVGLYGVLSYSVEQRTREIGIRIALGARQLNVVRTVVADVVSAMLVGAGFGLAGGLYLSRFVKALLFEVSPLDSWSLALPLGTLLLAALLAATLPTLRAARVDPVIALRNE
jgi:ABC-type antimicrobial peptide transport system permease subunit